MDISVPMNEQAVIRRAKAEPQAFAAIYDHYFPRVYSYVLYRVQDPQAAADITATVFERALTRLRRYDPARALFSTWLFTIARNAIKNHYRRQTLRRWLPLEAFDNHPSPDAPPESVVLDGEGVAALLAAVARLPERERELLALKFGAGLTNRRIAEVTGLTPSNVGVILYRATGQLRDQLDAFQEVDHA